MCIDTLTHSQDYSAALLYLQKAFEIQKKNLSSDQSSLLSTLYHLSLVLQKLSRYVEAIEHAKQAISIGRHIPELDEFELDEIQDHLANLRDSLEDESMRE
ncbi:hypothetical protein I4U23_000180 [Adineta vaga]|nr:hypothetical protein I4U23_000180 [Adineta vaga]